MSSEVEASTEEQQVRTFKHVVQYEAAAQLTMTLCLCYFSSKGEFRPWNLSGFGMFKCSSALEMYRCKTTFFLALCGMLRIRCKFDKHFGSIFTAPNIVYNDFMFCPHLGDAGHCCKSREGWRGQTKGPLPTSGDKTRWVRSTAEETTKGGTFIDPSHLISWSGGLKSVD